LEKRFFFVCQLDDLIALILRKEAHFSSTVSRG
jgi:hypothetical protein